MIVGKEGIEGNGIVIGGIVNINEGKVIPISKERLRLIVGNDGREGKGITIGGIVKLKVGREIPISKLRLRLIVGREGKDGKGIIIGGIEKEGKEQGPLMLLLLLFERLLLEIEELRLEELSIAPQRLK